MLMYPALFDNLIHFFFPRSSFVVDEIDLDRSVVVLADKSMGLKVEVKLDSGRKLTRAKVIAPYDVLVEYEDGTSKKVRFLK